MTYREARYVKARINGATKHDAATSAGFSTWLARNPAQMIETAEIQQEIERIQQELVDHTLQVGLIDAIEIHEYLTDAIRADWSDIEYDDGTFRPMSEWPEIWRRMKEAGDVEVEYESHRSHDGENKDGPGGWDQDGMVRKVKIKFASRVKLLELAMKHKGVNAMVEAKSGDTNILVVTAETARKVVGARKRLAQLTPTSRDEGSLHNAPSTVDQNSRTISSDPVIDVKLDE